METDRFAAAISWLQNLLGLAPPALVATILVAIAVAAALVLHAIFVRLLTRGVNGRHPFVLSLVTSTRGPTRLALMIFVVRLVIPLLSLQPTQIEVIDRVLELAFAILLGWIALAAVDIAASLYLRRYRTDVEDNLLARKHVTQVRILARAMGTLIVVITIGACLMTFDSVRQYGVTLFASAGVAGLIVGLAARPLLGNLIAGVQLAFSQPIRIDDAVVVENEYGVIEEITSTYVVVRLWDLRRLIVPLTYFIEKPFANWTREGSAIIGSVLLHLDYTAPIAPLREKAHEIVTQSPLWDGKVVNLQVTDATEQTIEVRVLVSARSAGAAFDLRCEVREKLIDYVQQHWPGALPQRRLQKLSGVITPAAASEPPPRPAV